MTGGTSKQKEKKKFSFLKFIWVLVFSFTYLVSVDPMDGAFDSNSNARSNFSILIGI